MQEWSLKQSLLWTQVSQLTFNIFVKVGYYPLLPLSCTCYWFVLLLCIVYGHTLSLSFELFNLSLT